MADRSEKDAASPWFEKDASDLRSAEVLLSLDPPELENALFHCQQAAEKHLKGLLAHSGQDPPRTHDLVASLDLLVPARSRLESLYEPAEVLAPYCCAGPVPLRVGSADRGRGRGSPECRPIDW